MKECLIGAVEGQIHGNLDKVDTKELGEAVDMIKDLAEAIYYCTITEAMAEDKDERRETMYYTPKKSQAREYYPHMRETRRGKEGWDMPIHRPEDMESMAKDPNEGKSGERRKMYMDGKGVRDKTHQMKELDNYMQELTSDITEMIMDASPEEKQLLQQKIATLASKIK